MLIPMPSRRKDCAEGVVFRRPIGPPRRKEFWVVVHCPTEAEGHWTSDVIEWGGGMFSPLLRLLEEKG